MLSLLLKDLISDFILESYRADTNVSRKLLLTKFKGHNPINIYIQELWFLRSAHRLMLVNISMKFHEDEVF